MVWEKMPVSQTLSRSDRQLMQRETAEAVAHPHEGRRAYEELCDQLDTDMRRFFPKAFHAFRPPTLDRTQGNVAFISQLFQRQGAGRTDYFDPSFVAGAAVRYVDNFIDEALWPLLEEQRDRGEPLEGIEERFASFLKAAYETVSAHDPYLPPEILQIPTLEMRFLVHPDQQTFDDNIEPYFLAKSFNLAYMDHLITKKKSAESLLWTDEQRQRYQLMAAWDVARDMYVWEEQTDFDIFRHIAEHRLNPTAMIRLLERMIQEGEALQTEPENALTDTEEQGLEDCYRMIQYLEELSAPTESQDVAA